MQEQLPPNCPMRKADYDHYCPSKTLGPQTYQETGTCYKQEACTKLVKDFKKMGATRSSKIKSFGN